MDVEMKVSGMSGNNNNEKVIMDILNTIDGIHHVEVHAARGIVKIGYDQQIVSLESICEVIEEQGYTVDR